MSDQTKDILQLTQEASSEWATMHYEKQRIMHNYGQLSRGRGGGNKWSCRELATRQKTHWAKRGTLGKEDHNRQGGAHWARRSTICREQDWS